MYICIYVCKFCPGCAHLPRFPDLLDRRVPRLGHSCSLHRGKTFFFQSEFKYTQGEVSKPWTWQKVPHAAAWQNHD